jgi:hypothetical protein
MNQPPLFSFPLVKIFAYFSLTVLERSDSYIGYGKSLPLYYVHQQPEQDGQSIFATGTLQSITKDELLYQLAGRQPLETMERIVSEINAVVPTSPMPQIQSYTTTQQILNTVMDFRENTLESNHWTQQKRFGNRIFLGKGKTFKMPLCAFSGKKFNRFLNCVTWDEKKRWYLNDETNGFLCSNSDQNASKLLITCNPRIIELVSGSTTGDHYLYLLAHEKAKHTVFDEILKFSKAYSYSPICLHIGHDKTDLAFICQFLNTYLFYSCPIPIWLAISESTVTVSIHATQYDYEKLNSFLTQLNTEIENHYSSNSISTRLPNLVLKRLLPRLTRIRGESSTRYILEMELDKATVTILLHELIHFFSDKGSLEILQD